MGKTPFLLTDERADKSVSAEVTVYVDLGEEFEDFDPELAAIFEGRDQAKVVPLTQFLRYVGLFHYSPPPPQISGHITYSPPPPLC